MTNHMCHMGSLDYIQPAMGSHWWATVRKMAPSALQFWKTSLINTWKTFLRRTSLDVGISVKGLLLINLGER